jgi:phospholipase/carboxylesterase
MLQLRPLLVVTTGVLAACSDSPTGSAGGDGRLSARPAAPTASITAGKHDLGLTATGPDGFIWVPESYDPEVAAPLIVLLHGGGRTSEEWRVDALEALFEDRGAIVLAPDSRYRTWDRVNGIFGPDVAFIDEALAHVFSRANIDPDRIAIGGFSDGGTYALSLGLTNGDLFTEVMAFSPGFFAPRVLHGRPRIFETHGTTDDILPINTASRVIVPQLRDLGYDVTYIEFEGGHSLSLELAQEAMAWWLD